MRKIRSARLVPASQFSAVKPTRFPELAYQRQGNGNWRILDVHGESVSRAMGYPAADPSPIGPQYPTERELLADLERYAIAYGCN